MKLIMVCTGNTCRSPLAEAIMLDKMKDDPYFKDFAVASCGIYAMSGDSASSGSIKVAKAHNLSLENHRAKPLTVYHMVEADRVYTMTEEQAEVLKIRFSDFSDKIFAINPAHNISDPYGQDDEVYEKTYQEINQAVENIIQSLKEDKGEEK